MTLVEFAVWAGSIGQTLFVIMWGMLPWWREWIGRALMVKAFALMLLFDSALLNLLWPHKPLVWVDRTILILVIVGIWSQVFALTYERRRARRNTTTRQDVYGTADRSPRPVRDRLPD